MTSTRNETEERARKFLFQYGPNVNIELVPAIMVLWLDSERRNLPEGQPQNEKEFRARYLNEWPVSDTSGEGQIVPWKFTIKRLPPTKDCPEGKFDKIIVRIGEWESEVPIKFLRISEVKNLEIMFEKVFAARPTETPQVESEEK